MSAKKNGKFRKTKSAAGTREKLLIAIAVVGILLAIALGALIFLSGDESEVQGESEPTESQVQTSENIGDTTVTEEPEDTTAAPETTEAETTAAPDETTEPEKQGNNQNKGGSSGTKQPVTVTPVTRPSTTKPSETQPPATQPKETEPAEVVISLPYVIPGTNLEVQRIAAYDGIYLEDGSDASVSGTAMILLKNIGAEAVEYAEITMQFADKVLEFETSALPAGGVVAVQERNKNSCATGDLNACTAEVAVLDTLGMSEDQVSIVDNGDNSLTVTNLTDKEIVTVRIFYKYYMSDENAYVGGITYTAKISNLEANQSVVVTPSHYATGASQIVMVRTYDTDA